MFGCPPRSARNNSRRMATATAMIATLTGLAATSPPAYATYPGSRDGRLAFGMMSDGNVDIYSALPNGSGLRRLTTDPSFDACAAYSPDGKHIAYCSNRSGTYEIWQIDRNGKRQRPVTDIGFALLPDYSPDGSHDRLRRPSDNDPNDEIYVVNADGCGLRQLTSATVTTTTQPGHRTGQGSRSSATAPDTSRSG